MRTVRDQVTTVVSRVRSRAHQLLHPLRHRRAKQQLSRVPRPRTVLVVCHGNVCRSPYLAAVLQRLLPDVEVTSAGFLAAGRPVPESGAATASRRGLDLTPHRSRLVTPDLLRRADMVIVMDSRQAWIVSQSRGSSQHVVVAADLDPDVGDGRVIRDPWQQSLDVFEAVFGRLDRCAATFAAVVGQEPTRR